MDKIQQDVLNDKQLEVDFIESGVIRVTGLLIEEFAAAVRDDRLTIEKVRALAKKLNISLQVYDKAINDFDVLRRFYKEKDASEKAKKQGGEDDNHQ